ncbi:MAG: hypothetical protein M3451_02465 [Chloroflexota bacterium]|nr:hypothetical protein [Chloroflexota bacterium]
MHSDELIRRGTMTTACRRFVWAVAMAAGLAAFAASGSTAATQYTAVDLLAFPGAYNPSGAFGAFAS